MDRVFIVMSDSGDYYEGEQVQSVHLTRESAERTIELVKASRVDTGRACWTYDVKEWAITADPVPECKHVQYRFPSHPESECVNAQCVDHFPHTSCPGRRSVVKDLTERLSYGA